MQDENEFVPQNSVAALALWNPDAIASWSLLFTPVFGSYFVMKNWQSIGDTEKARTAQNWLFISILMVVVSVIPVIGGLIYLIYLIIWYYACNRKQIKFVKKTWENTYPHKAWLGKPLLFGLVIHIVLLLYLVLLNSVAALWSH